MAWGDYEWYSHQQASYTELPDGYGEEAYDEYVEDFVPDEDREVPMTYEEWVDDNYEDLLYSYEEDKAIARAEAILDAREDYYR
jgi:hypothetical protein